MRIVSHVMHIILVSLATTIAKSAWKALRRRNPRGRQASDKNNACGNTSQVNTPVKFCASNLMGAHRRTVWAMMLVMEQEIIFTKREERHKIYTPWDSHGPCYQYDICTRYARCLHEISRYVWVHEMVDGESRSSDQSPAAHVSTFARLR